MLFDVTPMQVIENPSKAPHQTNRIKNADTKYPLDFFIQNGEHLILDGIHRLAKHYLQADKIIRIRRHEMSSLKQILKVQS
jgi:hypothetical protein